MKTVLRLGVLTSEDADSLKSRTRRAEIIVAKSWQAFTKCLSDVPVVYLPNYILQTLPRSAISEATGLWRLDAETRSRQGLPEFAVTGRAHASAPRSAREAARRLASDLRASLECAGFANDPPTRLAVWAGFFLEPVSLVDLVKGLEAPRAVPTEGDARRKLRPTDAGADATRQDEVHAMIVRIKDAIRTYGLTAADLGLARSGRPPAVAAAAGPSVKYGDGHGGVWSGRGKKPAWLLRALDAGRTLEEFLLAVAPASAGKPAAKKRVRAAPGRLARHRAG